MSTSDKRKEEKKKKKEEIEKELPFGSQNQA